MWFTFSKVLFSLEGHVSQLFVFWRPNGTLRPLSQCDYAGLGNTNSVDLNLYDAQSCNKQHQMDWKFIRILKENTEDTHMNTHILIYKVILSITQMLVAFYGISCITNVSRMIIYLAALAVRNSKGVENRNDTLIPDGEKKLTRADVGSLLLPLPLVSCHILTIST